MEERKVPSPVKNYQKDDVREGRKIGARTMEDDKRDKLDRKQPETTED